MKKSWTTAQKKIIDERGKNLLVSAAAGSGKTAVLTERIISLIMDGDRDTDIDNILVITFTRAAAAEMKERIAAALNERLKENPADKKLIRQLSLISCAIISTTDSFCGYIVNNYFQDIDLTPGFSIGDDSQLQLIRDEVLDQVMGKYYASGNPDFENLVTAFGRTSGDDNVREMVKNLCAFSDSYPDPRGYIGEIYKQYCYDSLADAPWFKAFFENAKNIVKNLIRDLEGVRDDFDMLCVPEASQIIQNDIGLAEGILSADDYDSFRAALSDLKFSTFDRNIKKKYKDDAEAIDRIRERRQKVKLSLEALRKKSFSADEEKTLGLLKKASENAKILSELTLDFYDRFLEEKKERRIFGFSDIAHFALEIVCDIKTGEPKQPAYDLAGRFSEIMTDEYQDTNYVQEMLLSALLLAGGKNTRLFMVGDVKQSIYAFRQARPEIFMEKAARFEKEGEDGENALMLLDTNFRSDQNVIRDVNFIFSRLMKRDFGGIAYDSSQSLKYRDKDRENDFSDENKSELVLGLRGEEGEEEEDKDDFEAAIIAERIKELAEGGTPYRDIAVLFSSTKYISSALTETFASEGIPAVLSKDTGYFDTVEIKAISTFLRVLCNPRVDIDLVGLMLSPFFDFTEEELAVIKLYSAEKEESFYDRIRGVSETENEFSTRLGDFISTIERYRELAVDMEIDKLLNMILKETHYPEYVMMRPGGDRRMANIELLISKAHDFEGTGKRTLHEFVRYMEKLAERELDSSQAGGSGNEDAVSVMTIHKSKGLEFPVVILAGLHKQLRINGDSKILIDPDYGAAIPAVFREKHLKVKTLMYNALTEKKNDQLTAEKMRLLYVALTRGIRKLIMVGVTTSRDLERFESAYNGGGYIFRKKMNSFLEGIYPVALEAGNDFVIRTILPSEIEKTKDEVEAKALFDAARVFALRELSDEAMEKTIRGRLDHSYPFSTDISLPPKVSVSELKHREADEAAFRMFPPEREVYVPDFARTEEKRQTGAGYGSAIHLVMQHLRFDGTDVASQITDLKDRGFIEEAVNPELIEKFLKTPLGSRVKSAYEEGKLRREQPFTMTVPAEEVYPDSGSKEDVMVQGVIDAWFTSGDAVVLLDYKSDRVDNSGVLVDRYRSQLDLYARALGAFLGREVTGKYIYSFCLNEVIEL